MESLKTVSGIQVLEHDLANKYDLPKHVIEQLDIYCDGSSIKECCKNKKNVSMTVLEWLFKKESITGWKLNKCMKAAAKNDNADLVNFCIHKGADDFNGTMVRAARGGHIDVVHLMMDHGTYDFNVAMVFVACCGHIDIVHLMIEHGADGFNGAMHCAAGGGYMNIVRLMIDHGANDFNEAMARAAEGGHIDVVFLMIDHGANENAYEIVVNINDNKD